MNKISFIIEFDEVSKTQEEQLTEFIEKTGIKFHVLENDNDLKKYEKYKEVIDRAREYINKYAWQEDIIGGIYTTTGKPAIDRYMQLEWDNCNELLDILKEVE